MYDDVHVLILLILIRQTFPIQSPFDKKRGWQTGEKPLSNGCQTAKNR
jgi:hypothetical protein